MSVFQAMAAADAFDAIWMHQQGRHGLSAAQLAAADATLQEAFKGGYFPRPVGQTINWTPAQLSGIQMTAYEFRYERPDEQPDERLDVREPERSWIAAGRKTAEGRVDAGRWAQYDVGVVFAVAGEPPLRLIVETISTFDDFGVAWSALGAELIPEGVSSAAEARAYYAQFGERYAEAAVAKTGVVVFEFRVL
jgi:ASC-1-like (ASCH) protein